MPSFLLFWRPNQIQQKSGQLGLFSDFYFQMPGTGYYCCIYKAGAVWAGLVTGASDMFYCGEVSTLYFLAQEILEILYP